MSFLRALKDSKKLGAAVLGVLVQALTLAGFNPQVADSVSELLMAYILGQSAVDVSLAAKGAKTR